MDIPSVSWTSKLRGVTLNGPSKDNGKWKMNLLVQSTAENADHVGLDLHPMAFLYQVDGSKVTPVNVSPAHAKAGDTLDPDGGLKVTPTGPVDIWFEFNDLKLPKSGKYFFRVLIDQTYGTEDSKVFEIKKRPREVPDRLAPVFSGGGFLGQEVPSRFSH